MSKNGKVPKLNSPFRNRIVGHGDERVDQMLANPLNYALHPANQQQALAGAIDDIGFIRSVTVNQRSGMVVDGHLRVILAARSGVESLPVEYVDLTEDEEAKALAFLDPIAQMKAADKAKLDELLHQINSDDERVTQMLSDLANREGLYDIPKEEQKEAIKKGCDGTDVDLIYTAGTFAERRPVKIDCCLAARAGWLYGIRSIEFPCGAVESTTDHKVQFVDNEFKDYNHSIHLEAVAKYHPKYATVRDLMTPDQCQEAGIEYYNFDQITRWAEELEQHCENVIVIPKYDCFADIPEKYILGYSVPTSYGGTPLPIEMFAGRRVHLLGGSPNKQIAYYRRIPEDVVSIDNNYLSKMAMFGQVWMPDGSAKSMTEIAEAITIPFYVALAISLGHFAAFFKKCGAQEAQIKTGVFQEETAGAGIPG